MIKRLGGIQLHYSSPHFQSDGNVGEQAAALFERTKARTLVVAGANRYAVKGFVVKSKKSKELLEKFRNLSNDCQLQYTMADAAHNNKTMFYQMLIGVLEAGEAEKKPKSNIFIQWHGMANTRYFSKLINIFSEKTKKNSCRNSVAYLSAGSASASVYNARRLAANKVDPLIIELCQ